MVASLQHRSADTDIDYWSRSVLKICNDFRSKTTKDSKVMAHFLDPV